MFAYLFSFLFFIIVLGAVINEYYSYKLGVVPMPTLPWIKKIIAQTLLDQGFKNGAIYELGSGWGGLAHTLAKCFPKSTIKAYELSPFPYLFSKLFYRRKNLKFGRADIFTANFSDADAIVMYLMPQTLEKLKPIFLEQLNEGTIIISSGFAIPGWSPIETKPLKAAMESNIYIYKI